MKRLYVIFDGECAFCVRCALWLAKQEKFVGLSCIARQSPVVRQRFGSLLEKAGADELLVVGDDGAVYRHESAYLMCLWSLRDYRPWAARLANPALKPLVRGFFKLVASNRSWISAWLGDVSDQALGEVLRQEGGATCGVGESKCAGQAMSATRDIIQARREVRSWG